MKNRTLTWEEAVQWLKSQADQQNLVRDCYYDEPLMTAVKRFAQSEEWQAVAEILSDWIPGDVLDLGAGNGISSYAFAQLGCVVTALEPDSSSIVGAGAIKELVQQADLTINVVQSYGENLPFADDSFDIVYGRQVLHHASDLNQLCREAARILRPNGVLIATREHVISKPEDLEDFLRNHPLHHLYGGENAFLLEQYRQAIVNAGLIIKKIYSPYDCVINYFPKSRIQFQEQLVAKLQRLIGKHAANLLINRQPILSFVIRYLSWRDHTPGRLYSFVATKSNLQKKRE